MAKHQVNIPVPKNNYPIVKQPQPLKPAKPMVNEGTTVPQGGRGGRHIPKPPQPLPKILPRNIFPCDANASYNGSCGPQPKKQVDRTIKPPPKWRNLYSPDEKQG